MTTNVQILENKMGEFMELIVLYKPQIISVTES